MATHDLVQLIALRPSDDMVTIEIGPKPKTFQVSRALLAQHSLFRNFQTHSTSGSEHKFVFEDLSPRAFNIFLGWLHTGSLPETMEDWLEHLPNISLLELDLKVNLLRLKTWVVAERLGAEEFLMIINNQYVENNFTAPWLAEVIFAFTHIPHDRRILNLLVDCHCNGSISRKELAFDEGPELQHQLPIEFFLRVMDRYAYLRQYDDGGEEPLFIKCDYHEHATEDERAVCREAETDEMYISRWPGHGA
ncbi:hypothetical protein HBI38_058290 [Parastagonospora nodorum]|nr:hypothetical protein HBI09_064930 [Parastagonospora nodorum]KAH4902790.1 hypothetical protein HBI80_128870 [Parastagonospora nodorum]KAH4927078.1 hypothetical protein HBI79_139410 [Parastagonospora nodorum]KAH5017699.1 hypothetical protein HBI77_050420 [Parastagonospora nodorum]KAH5165578.1 hypothetical protein HBI73_034750 [Parastagonospora nodorum]